MPNLVETIWEKITSRVEDTRELDGIPLIDNLSWLGVFEGSDKSDQWWDNAVKELKEMEKRDGWYLSYSFLTLHRGGYIATLDNRLELFWKHELLGTEWLPYNEETQEEYLKVFGADSLPPHLTGSPITPEWRKLVVASFVAPHIHPTLIEYLT